ncbi:SGNH/GDSL hydrolase family protein [Armatimonas sp.]|uniref:SGNH/GDSL hydrolase family protein n=1 Tax=Armatimonas sp. TaxID=1872638 RepID=UPI00286BF909|nr:SGNH/GDSL hydrolase family protein [Armatimonas sp.]
MIQQRTEPLAAFTPDSRILFQGDSITDGNRGRSADPNHILGHGYAFIIAAKHGAAFSERKLVFLNRGISGNKVTDLEARWQRDTLELKPDLLSILIGVNDTGRAPLEIFEPTYDKLLTETKTANTSVRFVLLEPFCLPVGHTLERGEAWVAELTERRKITARLAKKHSAVLVPCQKVFTDACKRAPADYWIWDGIHPTYSGHQLLADAWVEAVRKAK